MPSISLSSGFILLLGQLSLLSQFVSLFALSPDFCLKTSIDSVFLKWDEVHVITLLPLSLQSWFLLFQYFQEVLARMMTFHRSFNKDSDTSMLKDQYSLRASLRLHIVLFKFFIFDSFL